MARQILASRTHVVTNRFIAIVLQEVNFNILKMTLDEERLIVYYSGCLLLEGWDLSSTIVLDSIIRESSVLLALPTKEQAQELNFGSGYSSQYKALAVWSICHDDHKLRITKKVGDLTSNFVVTSSSDTSAMQLVYNQEVVGKVQVDFSKFKIVNEKQLVEYYKVVLLLPSPYTISTSSTP